VRLRSEHCFEHKTESEGLDDVFGANPHDDVRWIETVRMTWAAAATTRS
jgi:hypothetical protein